MNPVIPYNQAQAPQTNEDMSLKQKVALTLLGGLTLGLIVRFAVKAKQNRDMEESESQSFTDGNAATTAKKIKMAFENDGKPGTNTVRLREIFRKIKSKDEVNQISTEYSKQNPKRLLFADLKDELQSSEYEEMLAIKEAKPQKVGQKVSGEILYKYWAIRFKAGFDKKYSFLPGTDNGCLEAALQEIPTQRSFINVGKAYYKEFKRNIMTDLKSELEFGEYTDFMIKLTNKPKA